MRLLVAFAVLVGACCASREAVTLAAPFPAFGDAPAPTEDQPELAEPVGPRAFGCTASGATSGLALLVTLWLPMFVRRRRVAAIIAAVVMMSIAPAVRADTAAVAADAREPSGDGAPATHVR